MNLSTKSVMWHVGSLAAGAWGMAIFAQTNGVDLYALIAQFKKTWGELITLSGMLAPFIAAGAAAYRTYAQKQVPKDAIAVKPDSTPSTPDGARAVAPSAVGSAAVVAGKIVGTIALAIGLSLMIGGAGVAHAQNSCNVSACRLKYPLSFQASDCTYIPTFGAARQACPIAAGEKASLGILPRPSDVLQQLSDKIRDTSQLQAADALASAIDPDTNKMADPIAHACYVAAIQFFGSLPQLPQTDGTPSPVVLYERARLLRMRLNKGLPDYLKVGCAPLIQDETVLFVKVAAMVGVTVGTGGLSGIVSTAAGGLGSILPLPTLP